jgi:outer membrane protein OmpA-like peptidoglycan-associated protein
MMSRAAGWLLGAFCLAVPVLLVTLWVAGAAARLEKAEKAAAQSPTEVVVAAEANEAYCTGELKQILRRVLSSCGLLGASGGRGCQPVEARSVATMSGDDFNALFLPMRERGGIIQFDQGSADLDPADVALVDRVFADRRGASYFFVVSRASPEGATETNREISRGRAEAVLARLRQAFADPDLDRQVGLLWLGEEFAQLDPSFCAWSRSGGAGACTPEDLNRSAFVAWIDCTL